MDCLDYIHDSWDKFIGHPREGMISVPNEYISPNDLLFKDELFYWDSYFIIRGLLLEDKLDLARGMVEDFLFLIDKYGHVPTCNKESEIGKSQPPFLTSMVLAVYEKEKDKELLGRSIPAILAELEFWRSGERLVLGLSRYYGKGSHTSAELESGWDFTSRFGGNALNYLPVDLNALVYKYYSDLELIARKVGDHSLKRESKDAAESLKERIIDFMWDPDREFFFDYDFTRGARHDFLTVAGFYPYWVEIPGKREARNLPEIAGMLREKWGLANTQKEHRMQDRVCQWDWPNGWPNQQLVAVEALEKYGFRDLAKEISADWLELNCRVFRKTGYLWEKYDVVSGDIGKPGLYPTQPGFGWTNAVFLVLWEKFG